MRIRLLHDTDWLDRMLNKNRQKLFDAINAKKKLQDMLFNWDPEGLNVIECDMRVLRPLLREYGFSEAIVSRYEPGNIAFVVVLKVLLPCPPFDSIEGIPVYFEVLGSQRALIV